MESILLSINVLSHIARPTQVHTRENDRPRSENVVIIYGAVI